MATSSVDFMPTKRETGEQTECLLTQHFDAVVILGKHNSSQECFPYATSLSHDLPVILVCPDLSEPEYYFTSTDDKGITILHLYEQYGSRQSCLLSEALVSRHLIKPLLWIENLKFAEDISKRFAPLKIYHAIDTLSAEENTSIDADRKKLNKILSHSDLLICNSEEEIKDSLQQDYFQGELLILQPNTKLNLETFSQNLHNLVIKNEAQTLNHKKLNILYLYDKYSTHINTVKEYLESFSIYSQHNFYYASAVMAEDCPLNLDLFDVVVIHYSVRLCHTWYVSKAFVKALQEYPGFKVLYIQDEYECTETARQWMWDLGIHLVFTCVPTPFIGTIYPSSRLPYVEFINVLTGAVPLNYETMKQVKPLSERNILIGYRGRALPYYLGELAREKLVIGQKMRETCLERGLPADIEWDNDKRVYGVDWYNFIENCRATLGTESGSNVFDFDGELQQTILRAIEENPDLTYEEAYEKWVAPHDNLIAMNQISPKIFEAITFRTALVLFEGHYSGVIQPDVHFIPLKKDFSNIDEVLEKIQNDAYLQKITDRAYQDIIASGNYSYQKFVEFFDKNINKHVRHSRNIEVITGVIGYRDPDKKEVESYAGKFSLGAPSNILFSTENMDIKYSPEAYLAPRPPKPKKLIILKIWLELKRFVKKIYKIILN